MQLSPFHYDGYRSTDPGRIDAIVRKFPLALIVSHDGEHSHASHIPLYRARGSRDLLGHADAANPQFAGVRHFAARIVFIGADSYIPPEAYVTRQLPTWNYVSAHMTGTVEVLRDPDAQPEVLRDAAASFQRLEATWQFDERDDRVLRLVSRIVALRVHVADEEARIKLSQEKDANDRRAALDYLLAQRDRGLRDVLDALAKTEARGGE